MDLRWVLSTVPAALAAFALASGTAAASVETEAASAQPAEEEAAAESFEDVAWHEGWDGEAELGVFGSDGNTERFNLRAGFLLTKETQHWDTRWSNVFSYAEDASEETENRFTSRIRGDYKFDESKWRAFAQGSFEFDEFQNWDSRLQGFAGPGYLFIDNEKTYLLGRVGAGLTKEFGSSQNEFVPEALLGVDFNYKITERQDFESTFELYPSLADGGEFRFLGQASYNLLVDPEVNMTLRIGVEDRYDSDPGEDFKKNDVDYFAVLVWAF